MFIKIQQVRFFRYDLRTRMPFKYGIAVMTELPHLFVEVTIEAGGRIVRGLSADHLPPKWFTKIPNADPLDEVEEMLGVIRNAARLLVSMKAESVYELWIQLYHAQGEWGRKCSIPPLLAQFGTSLMERALVDAWCRLRRKPFVTLVRGNDFGIRLGAIHQALADSCPADFLPDIPESRIHVRHTVGLVDWLTESDIPDRERLTDGLPQSLESNIESYGLTQFKIKLSGQLEEDLERLRRIAGIIDSRCANYAFSLDGNEQFSSVEAFRSLWDRIHEDLLLRHFFDGLIFAEQPFHRDIALNDSIGRALDEWNNRPPVIIDESDGDLGSLPRALECGYVGTSHKNCKGVIKGMANRCLINHLNRNLTSPPFMMSGEDLSNIGPVALLQDLVVHAVLGNTSVERNGHQYFAGLSSFSGDVQNQVVKAHPDLYTDFGNGWPTLAINEGNVSTKSLLNAPFGCGFALKFDGVEPAWAT